MNELTNKIKNNPLVSIICATFNHENYIAQTIEGFLMQITNFSFEIIICEDKSTDGTARILKEYENKYPKLFVTFYHEENLYSKGVDFFQTEAFPIANGTYIAYCEGDDYWIDPLKLQKQVDFLEENSEYGMVYTRAKIFVQKQNKFKGVIGHNSINFEKLLVSNPIPTLTTCFRLSLLNKYLLDIKPSNMNWKMGDYPMWLYFAHESKIKFDNSISSIYRVIEKSASHFSSQQEKVGFVISAYHIALFYANKYRCNDKSLDDSIIAQYMWILFMFWCSSATIQLKNQIEQETKKLSKNNYLKIILIRITFNFPIFRYMFKYFHRIQ